MKQKYVDPDDLIKFKEITLRVTQEEFDEWKKNAKNKDKSLDQYIKDAVGGQVLKSQILEYLKSQAKKKPWWEKKFYTL